jgi:hypothetical protein
MSTVDRIVALIAIILWGAILLFGGNLLYLIYSARGPGGIAVGVFMTCGILVLAWFAILGCIVAFCKSDDSDIDMPTRVKASPPIPFCRRRG